MGPITWIKNSLDGSYVAVGYHSGVIEIYRYRKIDVGGPKDMTDTELKEFYQQFVTTSKEKIAHIKKIKEQLQKLNKDEKSMIGKIASTKK